MNDRQHCDACDHDWRPRRECWKCGEQDWSTGGFVVSIRGKTFGPFPTRSQADAWAFTYSREVVDHPSEIVTWEVRPIRCPDECACHAYMPPGRVCSWCQQEGHEDQ